MLGLPADARNYRIAAEMLEAMEISRVCLITNNPDKVEQLSDLGVDVVEQMLLVVGVSDENRRYLETKALRMGHNITFEEK